MIYGAYGYTGRLIVEQAKNASLEIIVAGRSEQQLLSLSEAHGVPHCAFDLSAESLDTHLRLAAVLLNCAGPFSHTARSLMEACIRSGTHYLDVSAELESYYVSRELDQAAKDAKVLLLPGAGGSVAMIGCLAARALKHTVSPVDVQAALHVAGSMSRGSAISAAVSVTTGSLQMKDGELVPGNAAETTDFDFGDGRGAVSCFPVALPDLITLHRSTGSPNIRAFVNVSSDALPQADLNSLPDGPGLEEREKTPYHAAVRVRNERGRTITATLHTLNGYTFTAMASVEAARRVLRGTDTLGWQTPTTLYGEAFLEAIPGTRIQDG